ncbi:MAG TPA: BON domain-containing protein [Chloroflexi bacterium]|nr:BON domain-containing protein [Chloroflexota bacterium]
MVQQIIEPKISKDDILLYDRVKHAIESLPMVRETHVPIDIQIEDGVVTLSGIVLSPVMRRAVLYVTATTPGVRKVVDNLTDDSQIEMGVAQALASDSTLKERGISVSSYQGAVTLSGKVISEEERRAAIERASEVPGARMVIDRLIVADEA